MMHVLGRHPTLRTLLLATWMGSSPPDIRSVYEEQSTPAEWFHTPGVHIEEKFHACKWQGLMSDRGSLSYLYIKGQLESLSLLVNREL